MKQALRNCFYAIVIFLAGCKSDDPYSEAFNPEKCTLIGIETQIKYLTYNGAKWSASLDLDYMFHHANPNGDQHPARFMKYQCYNGEYYIAYAGSFGDPIRRPQFKHIRWDGANDHISPIIRYIGWDGRSYVSEMLLDGTQDGYYRFKTWKDN